MEKYDEKLLEVFNVTSEELEQSKFYFPSEEER